MRRKLWRCERKFHALTSLIANELISMRKRELFLYHANAFPRFCSPDFPREQRSSLVRKIASYQPNKGNKDIETESAMKEKTREQNRCSAILCK